jgi:hypothetical protein
MTYKDNTPTFNVNRKVVNFKDFSANPNAEKEELKKMNRQNIPNSDEHQKNMANSRYKFNNTTRKMDDLSPSEIEDKIEAIEELEGTNESIEELKTYHIGGFSPEIKLKDKINELIEVVNKLEKEVKELKKNNLEGERPSFYK